jgi:glycine/D-amino acid oxidase-like deaminating enzyme
MNQSRLDRHAPLPASVLDDRTERYDVVVIGFGIAGGSAALEAARAGARVLLPERAAVPGGTTCMAGGHFYPRSNAVRRLRRSRKTRPGRSRPAGLRERR